MTKEQRVFHEFQPNGQHRIIIYNNDGVPTVGSWAECHQLAVCGTLVANSGMLDSLPTGVFTCRSVPHQVLV